MFETFRFLVEFANKYFENSFVNCLVMLHQHVLNYEEALCHPSTHIFSYIFVSQVCCESPAPTSDSRRRCVRFFYFVLFGFVSFCLVFEQNLLSLIGFKLIAFDVVENGGFVVMVVLRWFGR